MGLYLKLVAALWKEADHKGNILNNNHLFYSFTNDIYKNTFC